ncbi:MAG: glycosyltransferase family 2 protein [Planctomycetota bacterium]
MGDDGKVAVSVVICCADAAATLPAAIASAREWAAEVVVVDSGSSDDTAAIARAAADVYRLEPWRGYTAQKRFGTTLARHDWVLVLDGDEEVSPTLAGQVRDWLSGPNTDTVDVVHVKRRNWVLGRRVRAWDPDWQSRLVHRGRAVWRDEALHDGLEPGSPRRMARLSGHLEHKRAGPAAWSDYFCGRRLDDRLMLVAEQMHARGRRASWLDLWLRPRLAFWKFYLLKRGFLSGTFGLMIAQKAALSVQLKYAALWALQQAGGPADAVLDTPRGGV